MTAATRWALGLALIGCRSTPTDGGGDKRTAAAPEDQGQGQEMPESLRCKQSADCVQKPSCYWEQPSCVATAGLASAEKCGEDADPASKGYPAVACECFEGQCVAR